MYIVQCKIPRCVQVYNVGLATIFITVLAATLASPTIRDAHAGFSAVSLLLELLLESLLCWLLIQSEMLLLYSRLLPFLLELLPKFLLLWLLIQSEMAPTALPADSIAGLVTIDRSVSYIKISCPLNSSTTDLWKAVCKEQCLLSQDCLVLQLLLKQICEELSIKSRVSCLKIILLLLCALDILFLLCALDILVPLFALDILVLLCALDILVLLYIQTLYLLPVSSSSVHRTRCRIKSIIWYFLVCSWTGWFVVGLNGLL